MREAAPNVMCDVGLGEPQFLLLEELLHVVLVLRRRRWCRWWWCRRRRQPRGAALERGAPHLGLQVVLGPPHLGLQVERGPPHLGLQVEHNPQLLVRQVDRSDYGAHLGLQGARVVLVQRRLRRDPRDEEIHHGDAGAQVVRLGLGGVNPNPTRVDGPVSDELAPQRGVVNLYTRIHIYICICICMYICIYVSIYTHIQIQIHIVLSG